MSAFTVDGVRLTAEHHVDVDGEIQARTNRDARTNEPSEAGSLCRELILTRRKLEEAIVALPVAHHRERSRRRGADGRDRRVWQHSACWILHMSAYRAVCRGLGVGRERRKANSHNDRHGSGQCECCSSHRGPRKCSAVRAQHRSQAASSKYPFGSYGSPFEGSGCSNRNRARYGSMMPGATHKDIGCGQQLNEIAVSERGTLSGLTQILRPPGFGAFRKPLNPNMIEQNVRQFRGRVR